MAVKEPTFHPLEKKFIHVRAKKKESQHDQTSKDNKTNKMEYIVK